MNPLVHLRLTSALVVCLALTLSACGDGADPVAWPVNGGSPHSPTTPPVPPTATSSMVLVAPYAAWAPHSTTAYDDCGCDNVPQNGLWQGLHSPQFAGFRALLDYLGVSLAALEQRVARDALTVLAPNDAALAAWARELTGRPDAEITELLRPEHVPFLRAVVDYHLLGARLPAANWAHVAQVYTILPGGGPLLVQPPRTTLQGVYRMELFDGSARRIGLVQWDGAVGAGILHEIDRVMMPRTLCFIGHPSVGSGDPRRVFGSRAPEPVCAQPPGVADAPVPPSFITLR